jgi:hypothetical protein
LPYDFEVADGVVIPKGDMISPLRTWHGGGFSATDLPSRGNPKQKP